ncbi:MAG: hypothetical protein U0838_04320 [Chloroflexota bacterium]
MSTPFHRPPVRPALAGAVIRNGAGLERRGRRLAIEAARSVDDRHPQGGLTLSAAGFGGGLPWVLDRGSVELSANGKLEASVRHLVLAAGATR